MQSLGLRFDECWHGLGRREDDHAQGLLPIVHEQLRPLQRERGSWGLLTLSQVWQRAAEMDA
jgi:hypothetical protein